MKPEIGSERPVAAIQRGRYIGNDFELSGKTAFISAAPAGQSTQGLPRDSGWFAQVDDIKHDCAFGWWWFPHNVWEEV